MSQGLEIFLRTKYGAKLGALLSVNVAHIIQMDSFDFELVQRSQREKASEKGLINPPLNLNYVVSDQFVGRNELSVSPSSFKFPLHDD